MTNDQINLKESSLVPRSKASGFTLIELLVVTVIVGILAGIAVPTFLNQSRRARIAEAQSALTAVSRGSEFYRLANGFYPCNFSDIEGGPGGNDQYMDQAFSQIAPNYDDPSSSFCNPDSGVLWTTIAKTTAINYVNGAGIPLQCRIGIGDQTNNSTVDKNCNL